MARSGERAHDLAIVGVTAAMAKKSEKLYRDVVRAGYRAPHLAEIARDVVAGRVDPEAWRSPALDDENLRDQLLELPGIGAYAADNKYSLVS